MSILERIEIEIKGESYTLLGCLAWVYDKVATYFLRTPLEEHFWRTLKIVGYGIAGAIVTAMFYVGTIFAYAIWG